MSADGTGIDDNVIDMAAWIRENRPDSEVIDWSRWPASVIDELDARARRQGCGRKQALERMIAEFRDADQRTEAYFADKFKNLAAVQAALSERENERLQRMLSTSPRSEVDAFCAALEPMTVEQGRSHVRAMLVRNQLLDGTE